MWCIEEIKCVSDVAHPSSGKRFLQSPDPSEWLVRYNMDMSALAQKAISPRHFARALKSALVNECWNPTGLQIRTHKEFTKCDKCEECACELLDAKTVAERTKVKEKRRHHFLFQQKQRTKYYKHRTKAMRWPSRYLSIIADGMDQSSTDLPHYVQHTKSNTNQLDAKIQGLKAHGWGHFFFLSDSSEYTHGANHMAECLLETLKKLQGLYERAGVPWPDVLYLQLDGGSENKNRYILGLIDR